MNAEMVINALAQHGYRKVPQPLHVADIDFDFAGALTGPNDQESLTLVLEGNGHALIAAERRLRAFAVVLERTGSKRPINVVVIATNPDAKAITAIEELARVVVVSPTQPLNESLSALFPLKLPTPIASSGSAETALLDELAGRSDSTTARLIKAAKESSEKVRTSMHKIAIEALAEEAE